MAKEIERKFLVRNASYRECADSKATIRQAYLSTDPDSTIRVRTMNSRAFLTVKSRNKGLVRHEWEYEVPYEDAIEMMNSCAVAPVIEKIRYRVGRWEIDEFHAALEGLVIAEIELSSPDEPIEIPDYIGKEVSGDKRYYNSVLSTLSSPPSSDEG